MSTDSPYGMANSDQTNSKRSSLIWVYTADIDQTAFDVSMHCFIRLVCPNTSIDFLDISVVYIS